MSKEIVYVDGRRIASPEYRSWQAMKNRCLNPRARDYAYYGGKGVTVCTRWLTFDNFLADMGRRPTPLHTLDRIDPTKNYTPRNCRWATREQQSRNRPYAATRYWLLAEKLSVSPATAKHYIWTARKLHRGEPCRYTLSSKLLNTIIEHLGEHL